MKCHSKLNCSFVVAVNLNPFITFAPRTCGILIKMTYNFFQRLPHLKVAQDFLRGFLEVVSEIFPTIFKDFSAENFKDSLNRNGDIHFRIIVNLVVFNNPIFFKTIF